MLSSISATDNNCLLRTWYTYSLNPRRENIKDKTRKSFLSSNPGECVPCSSQTKDVGREALRSKLFVSKSRLQKYRQKHCETVFGSVLDDDGFSRSGTAIELLKEQVSVSWRGCRQPGWHTKYCPGFELGENARFRNKKVLIIFIWYSAMRVE